MTLSQAYLLAHDSEFRVLAGFTSPPRAATVTALEPSGQVRLALDDADGAEVLAWPLNGFVYGVGDVVYVLFAANSPESGLVLGAKAPLPALDAAVFAHDHAADYVARDGSTPLTGDWDMGDNRKLLGDKVAARDAAGLRLEDDGGNLGVFIKDGGAVGANQANPAAKFHAVGSGTTTEFMALFTQAGVAAEASGVLGGATYRALGVQGDGSAFVDVRDVTNDIEAAFGVSGLGEVIVAALTSHKLAFRTNNVTRAVLDTAGNLGLGTGSPLSAALGPLHIHNGTGGLLFVTKTNIDGTAQTIIPNGAGDVTKGLAALVMTTDGSVGVGGAFTLNPGGNQDLVVGTLTVRLACAADGSLTVKRQSGTGTATVALLGMWL